MDRILYDVAIGCLVAILGVFAQWQWPYFKSLFDAESRRLAKQIAGVWTENEAFADATEDNFRLVIHCAGGRVTGEHICLSGNDQGRSFLLDGTYKDAVITFRWRPRKSGSLESGAVTARL